MQLDFYLSEDNTVKRLIKEWELHGELVIAYDFDNTVYDYHGEGHSYEKVIQLLRDCKEVGAHLIVYTAREDKELEFVKGYLEENNIPYDTINEQPDYLPFKGKKLYYNILLDDRAGLASAYQCLLSAYKTIAYLRSTKEERDK